MRSCITSGTTSLIGGRHRPSRCWRLSLTISSAALLSACQPVTHDQAEQIADDVAADHVAVVEARVDDLEAKVADLENQISGVRRLALATSNNTIGLTQTVNANVEIDRKRILAQATRDGRCGTQLIQHAGWIENRTTPCTPALLGWDK